NRPEAAAGGAVGLLAAAGGNYLSYFSGRFLLTRGDDNLRHSIRGHGVLHPHDVALLALGAASCLVRRTRRRLFLLWWLAAYPLAASMTIDPRHAVRAICGLPAIYALEGIGLASLWGALRASPSRGRRRIAIGLAVAMAAVSAIPVTLYFRDYFVDYP